MGQYYAVANLDKEETIDSMAHPAASLKLTEFSYTGNRYVQDLLHLMTTDWRGDRVLLVGDYAYDYLEDERCRFSGRPTLEGIGLGEDPYRTARDCYFDVCGRLSSCMGATRFLPQEDARWHASEEAPVEDDFSIESKPYRYVANATKGVYCDQAKAPVAWLWEDPDTGERKVSRYSPFALFIAVGSGLGGGDYYGHLPGGQAVGAWALDDVYGTDEPPEGMAEVSCPFDESGRFVTLSDEEIFALLEGRPFTERELIEVLEEAK